MYRRGFTLIEMLIALSITLLIVMNTAALFRVIKIDKKADMISSQFENNTYTLSSTIRGGSDFQYGNELHFHKDDKDYSVKMEGGRLVVKPGSDILYDHISDVRFSKEDGLIYISFSYEGDNYRYWIGNDYEMEEEG